VRRVLGRGQRCEDILARHIEHHHQVALVQQHRPHRVQHQLTAEEGTDAARERAEEQPVPRPFDPVVHRGWPGAGQRPVWAKRQ